MRTICAVFLEDAVYSIKGDPEFGRRMSDAIEEHLSSKKPQSVSAGNWRPFAAWVIGSEVNDVPQVYVIRENSGERVTATEASEAALSALVDVLRKHGYTCRRSA